MTRAEVSCGQIGAANYIPHMTLALGVSGASRCTNYGCASSTFNKCGGYSTSESDSNSAELWTKGMHGMLCMMGLEKAASVNVYHFEPRFDTESPYS